MSKRKMLKEVGAKSVLVSFTELKRFTPETRRKRMEELRRDFEFVFVDSGAHSFFVEEGMVSFHQATERKEGLGDLGEWFRDYLQFALENHKLADGLAEFDVDAITGLDWVLERRKQAMGAGWPKEKYIPVFHSAMGKNPLAIFEGWCKEYPYVATEGGGGRISHGIGGQRKILEIARRNGARLHSFAMTGTEALRRVPYFSVDSTSWLSGSMFGVTFMLKGIRMVSISQSGPRRVVLRKRVLHLLRQRGIDIPVDIQEGYLADESKAVDWVHALTWAQWEKVLTENWKRMGQHCTCLEERGSCKFHGLGLSGNSPPVIVTQPQEVKDKIAKAQRGNLNALVHGGRCPRLPQLQCDTCYLADRCKLFEEGAACKADPEFSVLAEQLGDGQWEALVNFQRTKLEIDSGRYMRGLVFEAADGGFIDKGVTQLSAHLSSEVSLLAKLRGYLSDAPRIDNRQITLLIEKMPDSQYERLLDAVCEIREVAPTLLEGPGGEK